jgi:hypothetical protein
MTMRRVLLTVLLALLIAIPAVAQDREAEVRAQFTFEKMAAQIPGLKIEDYETAVRLVAQMPDLVKTVEAMPMRPLTGATPSSVTPSSAFVPLRYPPPLSPAVPPVPRITYPTTGHLYEWEAAHLRR